MPDEVTFCCTGCRDLFARWLDARQTGVTIGRVREDFERDFGPASETSEQEHSHTCPDCGDSWQHADEECQEPTAPLPMARVRRTWARCPMHEGTDE